MARILILEDEDDIGELYRLTLEAQGHEVVGVYAEPEAAISEAAGAPELVIVDERLGLRSGTAWLPRLRRAFPEALFVLVSADPDAVQEAPARGFIEGKKKPVTLDVLARNIRGLLAGDSRPATP